MAVGVSSSNTDIILPSQYGAQGSSIVARWDESSTAPVGSGSLVMPTANHATYNPTSTVAFTTLASSVVATGGTNSVGPRLSVSVSYTGPLVTNNMVAITLPSWADLPRRGTFNYRISAYSVTANNTGFGFGLASADYTKCVGWIHVAGGNTVICTNYNSASTVVGTSWPWRTGPSTPTLPRPSTTNIAAGYSAGTLYSIDYNFGFDPTGAAPPYGYAGFCTWANQPAAASTCPNVVFGGVATSFLGASVPAAWNGVALTRPVMLFNVATAGAGTTTAEFAEIFITKHPLDT